MPVSFKPPKRISIVYPTPEDKLVICSTCGWGSAGVGVKIDCPTCGGTGYENFFTRTPADVYYIPGTVKKFNYESGGLTVVGDARIKIDKRYQALLDRAEFIEMDDAQWKFQSLAEPGQAMGQARIVLALTRK